MMTEGPSPYFVDGQFDAVSGLWRLRLFGPVSPHSRQARVYENGTAFSRWSAVRKGRRMLRDQLRRVAGAEGSGFVLGEDDV